MNRRLFGLNVLGALGSVLGLLGLRRKPRYEGGVDLAVSGEPLFATADEYYGSLCSPMPYESFIQWIPVEVRLPETLPNDREYRTGIDSYVFLVVGKEGLVRPSAFSAWFEEHWGTPWTASGPNGPPVTHWAELPKGPTA